MASDGSTDHLEQGFSTLALLTFGDGSFLLGRGCAVYCGMAI